MQDLNSQSENLPERSVCFAFIKHVLYESEKPYYYSGPLEPDQEYQRTNLEYEKVDGVCVRDVRSIKHDLKLDGNGLEYLDVPSNLSDAALEADGLQMYLQNATSMLRIRLNAQLVLVYDYRYRASKGVLSEEVGMPSGTVDRPDEPANTPHIDHTKEGGLRRIRRHMNEEEAHRYLDGKWRLQILNLWRPLKHSVKDAPLAWCDFKTVSDDDLVAADRISPQYVGEVYYLINNDCQRWYYLSEQTPDEMTLFMSFDSNPKNGPAFCPHASFTEKILHKEEVGRQSLEIRAIVVREQISIDA